MSVDTTIRDNNTKTEHTGKENLLYIREFLNMPNHHGFAAIRAGAALEKHYTKEGKLRDYYFNRVLVISDCSNKISIDLGLGEDYENTIFKLNTLLKGITGLLEVLPKAKQLAEEMEKEIAANNEENQKAGAIEKGTTTETKNTVN